MNCLDPPEPGPAPNSKNDDSVQVRPLKMTRFGPPEPGPEPNAKNCDSVQARPLKMSRFGSPERRLPPVLAPLRGPGQQSQRHGVTQTTPWSAIPKTRRHPDKGSVSNPLDTAPPTRHAHQQSAWHSATQRQRPVKPTHQAVKGRTQRETSPHRPETARTGTHNRPPLRSTSGH